MANPVTRNIVPLLPRVAISGDNPTGGTFDPNYFVLIHAAIALTALLVFFF